MLNLLVSNADSEAQSQPKGPDSEIQRQAGRAKCQSKMSWVLSGPPVGTPWPRLHPPHTDADTALLSHRAQTLQNKGPKPKKLSVAIWLAKPAVAKLGRKSSRPCSQ